MNTAELAARSERVFGVGAKFFYGEPVQLVRDKEIHLHDATRKVRPTLVFGRDRTDAFPATVEEMVREFH